jgi:hypothetical protein
MFSHIEKSNIINSQIHQEIFTFGCWNNAYSGSCNFKPLISVMADSEKQINRNIHQSYILLGDNYYPQKNNQKKTSIINFEDLENGFKILDSVKVDKYFIMGNHDMEINLDTYKPDIFYKQFELCNNIFSNSNIIFPYGAQKRVIDSKEYLFIFIDTCMYDIKISNCYFNLNDMFNNKNTDDFFEIEEQKMILLINEQHKFIKETILSNNLINDIFVFAHYPLVTYKYKNNIKKIHKINPLIDILTSNIVNNKNVHYICADYHVCEYGIINNISNNRKIKQYIFGTGGTHLDDIYDNVPKTYTDSNIDYTILSGPHKTYGYGKIILTNNKPIISFTKTNEHTSDVEIIDLSENIVETKDLTQYDKSDELVEKLLQIIKLK